jgi:hypothetical protein
MTKQLSREDIAWLILAARTTRLDHWRAGSAGQVSPASRPALALAARVARAMLYSPQLAVIRRPTGPHTVRHWALTFVDADGACRGFGGWAIVLDVTGVGRTGQPHPSASLRLILE